MQNSCFYLQKHQRKEKGSCPPSIPAWQVCHLCQRSVGSQAYSLYLKIANRFILIISHCQGYKLKICKHNLFYRCWLLQQASVPAVEHER